MPVDENPVDSLERVVQLARERQAIASLLAGQRTLHESDSETLQRLIAERNAVVAILVTHGIASGRPNDFQYKSNFIDAIQKVAGGK